MWLLQSSTKFSLPSFENNAWFESRIFKGKVNLALGCCDNLNTVSVSNLKLYLRIPYNYKLPAGLKGKGRIKGEDYFMAFIVSAKRIWQVYEQQKNRI